MATDPREPKADRSRIEAFVAGADGCHAGWFVVIQYLESRKTEHLTAADFEVRKGPPRKT